MGGNKQVTCKICYREMRSDVLKRHMNVHEIKFLDEADTSFNQLHMMKEKTILEAKEKVNDSSHRATKRKI